MQTRNSAIAKKSRISGSVQVLHNIVGFSYPNPPIFGAPVESDFTETAPRSLMYENLEFLGY